MGFLLVGIQLWRHLFKNYKNLKEKKAVIRVTGLWETKVKVLFAYRNLRLSFECYNIHMTEFKCIRFSPNFAFV